MAIATDNYRESMYSALTEYRPGSFCIGGVLNELKEFIAPELVVEGLGPVELPLASAQAETLASLCSWPLPNAINDNITGPCLQLSHDKFRLTDNGWDECLRFLVNNEVVQGFGILDNIIVVPQLDRLLLLQPGESVPPHREIDKEVWGIHLGTLVISLPSSHSGGELLARHAGQQKRFPFVQEAPSRVHYAAHYADCEQEFLPVQKGYQLVLLYNISYQGVRETLKPPDNSMSVAKIREAIMAWSLDANGPQKMVVPLEGCFIMGNQLTFDTIRGSDRAMVEALMQSAQTSEGPLFHAYLATLAQREIALIDEEDDDVILERSGMLKDLLAPKGQTAPCRNMSFREDEILLEMLDDPEFFDERILVEATEDQGETVERWGSKAAIVVWPLTKRWDIALAENADKALQGSILFLLFLAKKQSCGMGNKDRDAATLMETVQGVRDALEAACTSDCHLSSGQATTVLNAVTEHGRLTDMEELRCALKAVQQADFQRLSSAQLSRMAKIVEEDAKSLRLMEERPGNPDIVPVCTFCKSTAEKKQVEKLRRCGGCLIPFYCGVKCQKAHRKLHKPYCKAVAG
ncbi:hypothetical protein KFL_002590140 [Klebsormidium nitens]|uniref:MYND-type domain-containing protein n=1 Tax=Klebsormidium nitens TaxID=105231 RepID=A0A1Y1IB10_KLENI|nr:hypothetical protein KFL_002590140 [Klebsormidium nitens]|eukprot:GAQ85886.1 hypothetical protein KFL_002590140 [Klebsormidium nitens]